MCIVIPKQSQTLSSSISQSMGRIPEQNRMQERKRGGAAGQDSGQGYELVSTLAR